MLLIGARGTIGSGLRTYLPRSAGYFAVWCHQEDAARMVHACFRSRCAGHLPRGAHYFVIRSPRRSNLSTYLCDGQ